jgi:hypothetical protein
MPKIKPSLLIYIMLMCVCSHGYAQTADSISSATELLSRVEQIQKDKKAKIDAAFTALDAVRKAGAYIESLSDLFGNGELTLPVGIKKGSYELIIQKILYDEKTRKSQIYATCAFQFKEDGQKVAFEGYADIEGQKGLGTSGSLELIAPVRRNLGNKAALVFNEGTKANFACEGLESFNAKLQLIITSDKIMAVDNKGKPTKSAITTSFDAVFHDFDNYTVSFGLDKSFCFKGLQDVVFSLKGATLDQSDMETSAMVKFPNHYFTKEDPEALKLWRGIAITNASVSLPAIFKKPVDTKDTATVKKDTATVTKIKVPASFNDRITLNLKNVLIDENGFTGEASGTNIISSGILDKSKWGISLSDFSLNLLKNELSGFGFGGDINIPPLGKNSFLPYKASYNSSTEAYDFVVNISGNFDFPVLRSTLSLNETSSIEILIQDSEIYPTLNATGKLTINAPINESDSTKKFSVPDINFENLKISRAEPYVSIGAIGITGELKSPKVAGFELSISDIRSFKNNNGSGLAFDAGIKLNDMFGGDAGLQLYGDYAHWKFNKVGIDKINVDFKSSAYSVKGGVWFKNGDEIYGSGFRGDIKFVLIDKFNLDAVAVFGKKDDFRYFLTDVYFETSPASGLIIPPALSFYGFGGGIYRKMQQSSNPNINSEFGKALSGIHYVPDKTVGMGFMATTKFGLTGSSAAFNAKVGFEMQFNDYGGLNFIQLRGDAAFMSMPDKWGKLADNINSSVKKLEAEGGKLKLAAKSDLKVPENKAGGFLTASLNVKYDLANHVFSADLSTYLNAGFIKGIGENDRMGWASAYFSPEKWYTYIGTPSDRVGIEILGLARADGYFMIGDDIPELPLPPQKVLQNFSQEKQDKLNKRSSENLASGSGIAFGESFGVNFKATLPPFYASLGVGMGAELLLKNYGTDAYCSGSSSTLGIDGWYARAQAWAWVEADIGMEAKIFAKRHKFSILNLSASALLAGAGPNPFYFTGAVGGRFSVMGGLISGKCDFDFEIGKECIIKGGSPFGEEIIAQLTPSAGEKDVNVFASPQAVFNIPVGVEMEVDEDEGSKAWYKVTLENYDVFYKDTKRKVEGQTKLSDDGNICMLDPAEPFESQKEMIVYAKVGFKRKLNSQWIDVKGDDGKPVFEEKTAEFISGDRPKVILPEHVKYSYPVSNQYNFYPNEYSNGYMLITENYAYLFSSEKPQGFDQMLRIADADGNKKELGFTYKTFSAGNDIRMEIDFPLNEVNYIKNDIYKLSIVNIPQTKGVTISSNVTTQTSNLDDNKDISVTKQKAEGTLNMLEEKEIYALHLRTSTYATFKEKMAAIPNYEGVVWQEYPHVYDLGSNIYDATATVEMFDFAENNSLAPDKNLVKIVPVYNQTSWYSNKVAPLIYENTDVLGKANMAGLKPPVHVEVIQMGLRTPDTKLSDDMIESNTRPFVSSFGAFNYRASYYIDRDFVSIRTALANKLVTAANNSNNIAKFLREDHIPDMTNGSYEIQMNYILPGKDIITSTVNRTIKLANFID